MAHEGSPGTPATPTPASVTATPALIIAKIDDQILASLTGGLQKEWNLNGHRIDQYPLEELYALREKYVALAATTARGGSTVLGGLKQVIS